MFRLFIEKDFESKGRNKKIDKKKKKAKHKTMICVEYIN